MKSTRSADPLRTLETVVGLIVVVMAVFAAALTVGVVAGTGSIPGLNAEVCVASSGDSPAFRTTPGDTSGPVGLSDGITWRPEKVQICDPDPQGATRVLAGAGLLVWMGGPVVFFSLLWRVLRRARRDGVFADQVPSSLGVLGKVLLVWAALDVVVTGFVDAALLNRMTDGTAVVFTAEMPWLLVLLGLALLALERVLAQAVDLRRDAEATI